MVVRDPTLSGNSSVERREAERVPVVTSLVVAVQGEEEEKEGREIKE